jgi:hypothetical protein
MGGCWQHAAESTSSRDDENVAMRAPSRAWVPPAGWPVPPPGWAPYAGWQPDPDWPEVPPGHKWWQLTRRGRRRRRIDFGAAAMCVVLFGGIVVVGVRYGGPCGFDPPPGDVGSIPIANNTDHAVELIDCGNAQCSSGINLSPLSAGHVAHWQYEMCSGGDVGVRDGRGVLVGCLVLPIGEPPKIASLAVSQVGRCDPNPTTPIL